MSLCRRCSVPPFVLTDTVLSSSAPGGGMYDYVVVGAGSAGCVLVARLTENPDVSVLLVEAGPKRASKEAFIPAAFSKLFRTERDWNYDTEPEPALNGRSIFWPRGRMVGGSSAM